MTTNGKPEPKSDPLCSWCGARIGLEVRYRGTAPNLEAPAGVIVCTPACPARPTWAVVEHVHYRDTQEAQR